MSNRGLLRVRRKPEPSLTAAGFDAPDRTRTDNFRDSCSVARRNDCDHPDSHVEDLIHLLAIHFAAFLEDLEK
jgi:hypothetical protein